MYNYNVYLRIMSAQDLSTLFQLRYKVMGTDLYLKRLEEYMRSCPTCWPTFVKESHYDLRVDVWRMLYRYYNVLGSYTLAFTFELFNRRLWGPYPEWDFCTCIAKGDSQCLRS